MGYQSDVSLLSVFQLAASAMRFVDPALKKLEPWQPDQFPKSLSQRRAYYKALWMVFSG